MAKICFAELDKLPDTDLLNKDLGSQFLKQNIYTMKVR